MLANPNPDKLLFCLWFSLTTKQLSATEYYLVSCMRRSLYSKQSWITIECVSYGVTWVYLFLPTWGVSSQEHITHSKAWQMYSAPILPALALLDSSIWNLCSVRCQLHFTCYSVQCAWKLTTECSWGNYRAFLVWVYSMQYFSMTNWTSCWHIQ